jgi:uncharacterized protein YlaN (UPF0358 family)
MERKEIEAKLNICNDIVEADLKVMETLVDLEALYSRCLDTIIVNLDNLDSNSARHYKERIDIRYNNLSKEIDFYKELCELIMTDRKIRVEQLKIMDEKESQ